MPENILLSWSGGKDSARALYEIEQSGEYSVAALLRTVTEDYDRVSMHGVRRELLERQAEAIGLPLEKVLPQGRDQPRVRSPNAGGPGTVPTACDSYIL